MSSARPGGSSGREPYSPRRHPWRRSLLSLAVLPALFVWACGSGSALAPTPLAAPTPLPTPEPSPRVVILSVDGLRADVCDRPELTNIRALARRGAYSWKAQTVFPPITLNSHASMLSGQAPSVHRISWNDYQPERGYIKVPTVFSLAKAAGLRTVMVAGKSKLLHIVPEGTIDKIVLTPRGDQDIANEAIVQVQAGFDLMFVHFPDTDVVGHDKGWTSANQLAQTLVTDGAIGRLLTALPPETTVILTADHGGHAATHGVDMPEDMTIPWIIAGPKVTARGDLTVRIKTTDTAATALYVFGLQLDAGATGAPVTEVFGAR